MTAAPHKTNPIQPKAAPRRPLALLAAGALLAALAYLGGPGSNTHVPQADDSGQQTQSQRQDSPDARPADDVAGAAREATAEPRLAALPSAAVPHATSPEAAADQGRAPQAASSPDEAERMGKELLATGRNRLADGDLAGGLEAFESAVAFYPSAETHGALGWLYFKMHVGGRANVHLRSAAMLDPDNADRWIDLANAEIQRSEVGEAWKAIDRAREAEPGIRLERDEDGYFQRGDEQESDAAAGRVGDPQGRNIE